MIRLEFNEKLGRMLRLDDIDTLGIATQTLAEDAIRDGRSEDAIALVDYYHQEMRIMHDIMITWLTDINRYLIARGAESDQADLLSTTLFETWRTFPIGEAPRERCKEAIVEDREADAIDWLEKMRLEFKNPHEILVAWVQNLLTYIAGRWGEDAVLDSILETHQNIWGDRYDKWHEMTPLEKLALTVEGMRGGHFSGPTRRGDMILIDQGDRYKMVMDPCGSGGVLRRGDPETGRAPHPVGTTGINSEPKAVVLQKSGHALVLRALPHRQGMAARARRTAACCAPSTTCSTTMPPARGTSTKTKPTPALITIPAPIRRSRPMRRIMAKNGIRNIPAGVRRSILGIWYFDHLVRQYPIS